MRNERNGLARLKASVGRNVVLPVLDRLLLRSPWRVRDHLFRELAMGLGVSSISCEGELGRFEGDPRDEVVFAMYFATKTWAPEFHGIVRDHVLARRGGTLLDVGANIGLTSIPLAKARGTTCHVFEPEPTNFGLLLRNIAANEVDAWVHPQNFAVMDSDGVFEFERSSDNMGDHRVRIGGAQGGAYGELDRTVITVPARRLDTCVPEQLAHPIVLKTDTQGADARVLRGAERVLREVDVVFAEYWPYGLSRVGDSPEAFFESLTGFDYGGIVRGGTPPPLVPRRELIERLRAEIPNDGHTIDHLDVVLARTPEL